MFGASELPSVPLVVDQGDGDKINVVGDVWFYHTEMVVMTTVKPPSRHSHNTYYLVLVCVLLSMFRTRTKWIFRVR